MSRSELPGTYAADHRAARETLTLLPDGTFVQRAALKSNSQILVANGKWTYNATDQSIGFDDGFLLTTQDGLGQPMKARGTCDAQLDAVGRGLSESEAVSTSITVYYKEQGKGSGTMFTPRSEQRNGTGARA